MTEKIIVVGDDGINTLGIIRSLGEVGFKPDVVITIEENKKVYAKHSKYINNCFIVEKNENVLLRKLMNYDGESKKKYLFPTSDYVLKVIGDNYDILRKKYILPSVSKKIGTITDALRKNNTFDFAKESGFLVPRFKKVRISEKTVNDSSLKSFFYDFYPLIIKSDCFFENETGFIIVDNEKELDIFLNNNVGKTVIIQQCIDSAEELSVQCVCFGNKYEPKSFGVIHKIRTSVFALGTTTYAVLKGFEDKNLYNQCINFVKSLDYSGICDLDILSKNGKYYFIECNFRNGSNGYAYTKFGANLPEIWIKGIEGLQRDYSQKDKLVFVNDIGDFAHVFKKNLGLIKWLYQYISADCRLSFNAKDPIPFFAEVFGYLINKK